ncbi:hypothetical protein BH20ACT24_BH20ACT24_03950 [soil metagenome]
MRVRAGLRPQVDGSDLLASYLRVESTETHKEVHHGSKEQDHQGPRAGGPAAEQPQSFRSYNRVQLAGRLVADPDLKYTPSGKAVCRMRLATNDTKVAQFHDIVAWEGAGESAAESLRKGAAVTVEGRLQTRTWEAADGSPRRATEIIASAVNAA